MKKTMLKIRNRDRNFGQNTMVLIVNGYVKMSEEDITQIVAHRCVDEKALALGYRKTTSRVRGTIWYKKLPDGKVSVLTEGSKKAHVCGLHKDKYGLFFMFRKERVTISKN